MKLELENKINISELRFSFSQREYMWRFLLRELTGQTDTSDQAYMKSKKRKDRLT